MAAATSDDTLVESVRLLQMEGVGDELFSIAAWSPLARLSSSSPPAASHGELDAGDLPAIGTTARSCPASIWGTTPAMYLANVSRRSYTDSNLR
jgi:hypothetical protein